MASTYFADAEVERGGRTVAITVEYRAVWEARDLLNVQIEDAFITVTPHGKILLTDAEDEAISEKITATHEDYGE